MEEVELDIEKMVFEGQALARMGRYVVFVEGALPGERVKARIVKRKRQFAVATATEVLVPSPGRVESDCPLFRQCGGCTFRHCTYPAQLKIKRDVFLDSLSSLPEAVSSVSDAVGMTPPNYYRNKMVFGFGMEDGVPVVGLHRRQDYRHIVPTYSCLLQSPESNEITRRVAEWVGTSGVAVFDGENGQGVLRDIMIREGKGTGQRLVQVTVTRREPALNDLSGVLDGLCDTVLVGIDDHVKGPARPHEFHVLKGDGIIMERLNGLHFEIGPETFFQTNTVQAEKMFAYIRECAAETRPNLVLDLYSGVGSIALHLAAVAGRVLGVESNEASVRAAERNIRRNGMPNVEMRRAEVEKTPEGLLPNHADLVVVDPPRPGLHKRAIERIGEMAPDRILYISCNPATLTRDLALFAARGYRTDRIRLFDMFPHTFHIESVSLLKRV